MANTSQNILAITRTLYGTKLQTEHTLGLTYEVVPNTTQNEHFDVQADQEPQPGVRPTIGYLGIGNMGHKTVVAEDGSEEVIPRYHRNTDSGFYSQIPIVLREVTNDLPAELRNRYAMRVRETHDEVEYYAYYLKRINMEDVRASLQRSEVVDGVETTTPFNPTSDNLNPTPPKIDNQGTILGSDSSVFASAVLGIALDSTDIAEILNAHQIRTGSNRSPVVSEFGLISGVDKTVSANAGSGSSFTYEEVICAQINVFICGHHAIGYSADGLDLTLDVGGVEPELSEDSASATFLGS